jgi:hypothetical protein
VKKLPTVNGKTLTADELLEHIRLTFHDHIDTRVSYFEPYDEEEARKSTSSNPLTAVIHIDMRMGAGWTNPDDGSVVVAEAAPDHWIFSTIWTPADFAIR